MSDVQEVEGEIVLEHVTIDACADPDDAMLLYRERITPDFLLPQENYGREVMQYMHFFIDKHGVPPTRAVMQSEFPEVKFDDPTVPVDYIIEQLRERKARQELQEIVAQVARDIQNGKNVDAVNRGFYEFNRIKGLTQNHGKMVDVGRDWREDFDRYKKMVAEGSLQGMTWGWPEIDLSIGGFVYGLAFVTGRPGKGKSWAEIKMGIENARQGRTVVMHTLEMSVDETFERIQCMIANVSYRRKTRGMLTIQENLRIEEEMTRWQDEGHKLIVLQPPVAERTVPGLVESAQRYDPDLILIDQFKYIMPHRGGEGKRWERSEYICEDLKIYSDKTPLFVAAQINRAGGAKEADGGDAEHIAVTDAILQHADLIFRLHQNKDMAVNKIVELGVLKARRATLEEWWLKMDLNEACDLSYMSAKED